MNQIAVLQFLSQSHLSRRQYIFRKTSRDSLTVEDERDTISMLEQVICRAVRDAMTIDKTKSESCVGEEGKGYIGCHSVGLMLG